MNSSKVNACVFRYAQAVWEPIILTDETTANAGIADIVIVKPNHDSIEIEVKVSLSDLKAEAKKGKYTSDFTDAMWDKFAHDYEVYTNYFYFAIPKVLVKKAKPYIEVNYPYAGIITCWADGHCEIVKEANLIREKKLSTKAFNRLVVSVLEKYAFYRIDLWEGDNELRI